MSEKTAFLFPGQGAQYIGMGQSFLQFEESAGIFDTASGILGFDMKSLIGEKNDRLNKTEYTQPAMITVMAAMLVKIDSLKIKPDVCAGLSLGEYAALLACGVMEFEELLCVVRKRGILMENAAPGIGGMAAVLGADPEMVRRVCAQVSERAGVVAPANYNCPGQIVISGEKEALRTAGELLLQAGAKRVVMLNVSGPFHSPLLKRAGEELRIYLDQKTLHAPQIPYIANLTADYVTADLDIREILARQVYSPVMWQQTIERMIEDGVTTFVEIGPGKTLAGFLRKIDKSRKVINIEKADDLALLVDIGKGRMVC